MTAGRYTFGKCQKEEPKMKPSLRLSAALLALCLLAGCTAGLGTEPTVTEEPIAATAENALTAALANAAAGDVPYIWMEEDETTEPLLEPAAPQMDKQTAANNAAAVFSAAGLEQEGGIRLGLVSVKGGGQSRILSDSLAEWWPDVDAVYLAAYEDSDGSTGFPAVIFDAITGKVYFLYLDGDPMAAYGTLFDTLLECPPGQARQPDSAGEDAEAGDRLPDPRYAGTAQAANDWTGQACADPLAFLNRLMPLLGWQAASVERCGAEQPLPDFYGDFYQQAVANNQLWPYLLNITFTTADGSHWSGTWDPILEKPVLLVCLGSRFRLPDSYRGDWGDRGTIVITPGQPVDSLPDLSSYALQDGSGTWRAVTCMDDAGWQSLLADEDFSIEKHLDTLYWHDPAGSEYWRPLSDGFPAWDPAGQPMQTARPAR